MSTGVHRASSLLRGIARRVPLVAILALGGLVLPSAAALAGDSFACGNRIVTTGMTDTEVRAACGEPEDIRRDSILRRPTIWRQGRPIVVGAEPVPVPVETWLYNFGPNRLMRRLRFTDGVLEEVRTLGYGENR